MLTKDKQLLYNTKFTHSIFATIAVRGITPGHTGQGYPHEERT